MAQQLTDHYGTVIFLMNNYVDMTRTQPVPAPREPIKRIGR